MKTDQEVTDFYNQLNNHLVKFCKDASWKQIIQLSNELEVIANKLHDAAKFTKANADVNQIKGELNKCGQ